MVRHAKIVTLTDGTLCFKIPTQDGFDKVNLTDIVYLEGASTQTTMYLTNHKKILADNSLMYWGEPLLEHGFGRTHHSYVINLLYFNHYQKGRGGYVELTFAEATIPVSETLKESFMSLFKDDEDSNKEMKTAHPATGETAPSVYVSACPPYAVTSFKNNYFKSD